jgi:hypothetical protein
VHPLHVEQVAHIVTEERLLRAADARRVRALLGRPRTLRDRVGAGMVTVGTRLQTRAARPTTASTATPC